MISFLKEVVRQHYLILFIAIFSAIFWPQIREQYYGYIIGDTGTSEKIVEKTVGKSATKVPKVKLFTNEDLAKYNGGENSLGLYLGIMGSVYDVQKGAKHYGVGGGYHFFSGKIDTKHFFFYFDDLITNTDLKTKQVVMRQ